MATHGPPSWPDHLLAKEPSASAPVGGQPTQAMIDRAEAWCDAHGVDPSQRRGAVADLAVVFSLWAAEYYRRGQHSAGMWPDKPAEPV